MFASLYRLWCSLKGGQRVGFVFLNVKEAIESRISEDFVDIWPDVGELQRAALRFDLAIQSDQLAQGRTAEKLDGGNVKASLENGILSLDIPIREEAKAREIFVN